MDVIGSTRPAYRFDVCRRSPRTPHAARPACAGERSPSRLLRLAQRVEILEVDDGSVRIPAEQAAAYLSRHDIHAELVRFVGRMGRIRTETCGGRGLELERRAASLLISADVDAHVRDSTDGVGSKPADSPDGGTAAAEERRS